MVKGTRYDNEQPSTDTIPVPVGDRRLHARYELKLAITMQGENNFYTGLSENISEGGIFIATSHQLAVGTPVRIELTLPSSDTPLSVFGTVQWVRGPDATARSFELFGAGAEVYGAMPGIGVRFHDLGSETLRAIRAFMARREPVFFDV
jgi:uncharacterized protein (TIGR02266 family)